MPPRDKGEMTGGQRGEDKTAHLGPWQTDRGVFRSSQPLPAPQVGGEGVVMTKEVSRKVLQGGEEVRVPEAGIPGKSMTKAETRHEKKKKSRKLPKPLGEYGRREKMRLT